MSISERENAEKIDHLLFAPSLVHKFPQSWKEMVDYDTKSVLDMSSKSGIDRQSSTTSEGESGSSSQPEKDSSSWEKVSVSPCHMHGIVACPNRATII